MQELRYAESVKELQIQNEQTYTTHGIPNMLTCPQPRT
jgi:hypothetical protein